MNIFLVAGPDAHAVQSIWQTLQNLGVQAAKPSRREGLLPEHIHDLMRKALVQPALGEEVDGHTNFAARPNILGKVWHELAADLCLGNIGHRLWGWPMADTAQLLDYWLDFDPNIRLVLAYISPIEHLQQEFQGATEITPGLVEQSLAQWGQRVEALLARFHASSPRCLLVHASTAHSQPMQLAHAMRNQWAVHGLAPTANAASVSDNSSATYQQALLAQMVCACPAAELLWQELEATVNVGSGMHPAQALTDYQHWAQQAQQAKLAAERLTALDAATKAKNEQSKQLLAQAEQAQTAITKIALAEAEKTQLAQAEKAEKADMAQENDLLLHQLHQVQEELEHYFLQYQDAAQKHQAQLQPLQRAVDFWQRHPPEVINLNLCEDIDGQNWYHPESDGRWAGPELVSTLQMPPVPAGRYMLELHIKDAMQPEIVLGQQILVLAQNSESAQPIELMHDFASQGDLYPMVSIGMLEMASQQLPWTLQISLPHNISPADSGGDDTRRLGIKLQAVRLIRQNDTSDLTA